MKRFTIGVMALALAAGACSDDTQDPVAVAAPQAAVAPAATRYIVALNGNTANFESRVKDLGGRIEALHAGAGLAVVSGLSEAASANLRKMPSVVAIESSGVIRLDQLTTARVSAADELASQAQPQTAILNAWQWNMRAIGADKAWAASKLGSPAVTVAILDTGLDYNNRDLTGLVDLTRSKSFVPDDDAFLAANRPGRHPIADMNGHGTNVGATVSSKAFAFAGVTSQVTLIGVKVLGANGSGDFAGVMQGVLWAADNNADVINMSLGGGFSHSGNGRYVGIINHVFNYARSKGSLVVVAAGNSGWDLDHLGRNEFADGTPVPPNFYATYCEALHVVCVSALGPSGVAPGGNVQTGPWLESDTPAFYTNYGKSITVSGPGGSLAGFVWSFCARDLVQFSEDGTTFTFPCTSGGFVSGMAGTSQATPHVSGLAALIISETGQKNPDWIKREITRSAVDLGKKGDDDFFGKGRISVTNALGL